MTWSTLSAMLLSLVMISGCNEEPSSSTPAGGTAGAGKAPEGGKAAPAPAPTPPKTEK
jgi:hypothetical protein